VAQYQAAAQAAADAAGGGGGGGGEGGGGAGLPPGVKVEGPEVLAAPGSKDGENKLVREVDGSVWAYGWDLAKYTWEKIGEVVSAPEAGEWEARCRGGGGGGVRVDSGACGTAGWGQ
jgi:hypothetical protein